MKGKNEEFVTLDCQRMPMRTPEQLKIFLKNSSTIAGILDKSHDVVVELHQNLVTMVFSSTSLNVMIDPTLQGFFSSLQII